ncbi:cell wall biosynthesis glycosyltransferase [Pseudomonas brassicacearum]|uniref:Cell wall biosynthesis glycosyltransferase n=1 Tax=Pseudomonas brassicacearum TaxID=930166 RepID=A0A423IGG8_9PSED|nr:glycosyltransferase family 2 protein [Pseudomonas brassicacearum]RON24529.1 cell wall biosynthesis glycosyltransferase [Pseudomonas brassicacearum]
MHKINKPNVWVVIAAFEEGSVIAETVTTLLQHVDNIIVVDDCSRDKTAAIAFAAGAHVLSHPINLGQGAALQTGITYALQQGGETIVTFDADGQHDAREIAPMLEALETSDADLVLGSRFLGKTKNISTRRRLLLGAALFYTRVTARIKITDVHNGFRVLTRKFCETFEFQQNRMAHASEILDHIAVHRTPFIEFPVTITYTDYSIRKGQKGINAIRILMELLMGRISK